MSGIDVVTQQMAESNVFSNFLIDDTEESSSCTPKDAIQMYVEAAAVALTSVDKTDPQAAIVLKNVIEFLVSDSRLKPNELDQQKKLVAQCMQ